ncbi:hypothetical protein OZX62_08070 [Bifidobacterium sp. ESL0690]|uniref:hypothetical protein n=1 Tax=Bifidobacterium sp. ESL0690 TaxID=2983214 RepID=UPI0023F98A13|nr:hypothetical protein [Bifidobacterium sp. ESL0690]WEV46385.1 hypothetical protein OZX62_08070 [Bifidobacterium sp. ESL0690]
MNITYERSGCKQFFKKHRDDETTIKTCIENALNVQLGTGMSKVKRAVSARVDGQCVYEFRVNLKRTGSARVAFIIDGNYDDAGNHFSNNEKGTVDATDHSQHRNHNLHKQESDETSHANSGDSNVTVLFISSTLQKDEFTHLLEHDLKEAGLCD